MTSDEHDITRLRDILTACHKIKEFIENRPRDEVVENAVIRQIAIIGEAANHLSGTLRKKYADIEWSAMIGIRNILVHQCEGTDPEEVWGVIDRDIPRLKTQIQGVLDTLVSAKDAS